MPVPLLDLKAQHATIKDGVVQAMMQVVDDQLFILGKPVQALEAACAALSNTKHAIGCASGTDALLLALKALDIGRGDEVVTTPFTFFATAGTIHNAGATPVFADIEADTFNLSVPAAKAAITQKTKAVIPVDLFGQIAPIETFLSAMPGMPIIEDAAQSIGAKRCIAGKETMAGERATIGTFSFFPSKNLGGYGDGGMMVTQDDAIAARLFKLRTHGATTTYYHTKWDSTAGSTRCRRPCCSRSSRTSPSGVRRAARTRRSTTTRSAACRTSRRRSSRRTTRRS